MNRVENKVVIVTGGCGGAGIEICKLLCEEGARVVVSDLNEEVGTELVSQIKENKGEAIFVKTDVTKEQSVIDCIDTCIENYGHLDSLINIACIMSVDTGFFTEVTEEMFDLDININLKGTFFFIKNALPYLLKQDQASIVNFSSIGGSRGTLGHTIYGAAKAGVESITRSIAAQYGKQGIRCNCIRPGIMLNPVTLKNPGCDVYADFMLSHIPGKRIGMGKDAAPLALFLVSDESTYINGEVITLDGGLTSHEPQWKEDMDPSNSDAIR